MKKLGRWAALVGFLVAACGADSCDLPINEEDEDKVTISASVQGTWTGTDFTLLCQPSGTVEFGPSPYTLALTQTVTPAGITVSGTFSATDATGGTASGTVNGTLSGTTLTFATDLTVAPSGGAPCTVSLTGTGAVSGNSMTISLSGNVTTGSCCGGPSTSGNVSGTATATR